MMGDCFAGDQRMSNDRTVDPREVEYYTHMAKNWWDQDGPIT